MSFIETLKRGIVNSTGLTEEFIYSLCNIFKEFKSVEKVVLFGSRAKGVHKSSSDIDIAIFGNLKMEEFLKISIKLDDIETINIIDALLYKNITNNNLKEHISRVGKVIYTI